MKERVIAIGDIHGCATALGVLLEAIQPRHEDTIISLGDVVDRGPESRSVIEKLIELQGTCQLHLVYGNHEEMMLAVVKQETGPQEWLKHGGVATLDSYGFSGDLSVIPTEHIAFLESAVPYLEMEEFFFVHGNYDPKRQLSEQSPVVLRWTSLIESTPGRHVSGKKAILGHTPDKTGEIFDIGHLMCIDTYCYGGGWLTAADVANGRVWQANEQGELRA